VIADTWRVILVVALIALIIGSAIYEFCSWQSCVTTGGIWLNTGHGFPQCIHIEGVK
jgi:hypothetical protein